MNCEGSRVANRAKSNEPLANLIGRLFDRVFCKPACIYLSSREIASDLHGKRRAILDLILREGTSRFSLSISRA